MEPLSNNCLKFVLSPDDMESLDITYESIDPSDPCTKRAVTKLLAIAKLRAGFELSDARLVVEVFPTRDGGCAFYLTMLDPPDPPHAAGIAPPTVFRFPDADTLMDACNKLFERHCHKIFKSSLYLYEGRYYLTVRMVPGADQGPLFFLGEYGELICDDSIGASFFMEHGTPLIEGNAIEKLSVSML